MKRGSLRLRLTLVATALIALALVLAGLGLVVILDRVLDARIADDLDRTARFLTGQVSVAADGALALAAEPPDPRFAKPYGGLYWQIVGAKGSLQSRSLWDKGLALKEPAPASGPTILELAGPDGSSLIASVRRVEIGRSEPREPLTIAVALDRRELAASRATYLGLLTPSLLALGIVLALAMWVFVARALSPFATLRGDLADIHDGRRTLLERRYPDEVQPLVDDLNRLIRVQERALERARTQAGDMAHGLKTPLAVLAALARRLQAGQPEVAAEIDEQAGAMRAQAERALVRARIAAAGRLQRQACMVAPLVARLVSTLRRLPDADSLSWEIAVAETLAYPGGEGDLTEMLGNLLDNARKWAHRRVVVTGRQDRGRTSLVIEDDGPGMSEAAMARIGRGRRWDETKPGTGFGIAIAADLAEETGASLTLSRSQLGGLKAEIAWNAR